MVDFSLANPALRAPGAGIAHRLLLERLPVRADVTLAKVALAWVRRHGEEAEVHGWLTSGMSQNERERYPAVPVPRLPHTISRRGAYRAVPAPAERCEMA